VGLGGETVVARALPAGEDDRHGRGESARLDKLNEETGWRPLGELDQEMGWRLLRQEMGVAEEHGSGMEGDWERETRRGWGRSTMAARGFPGLWSFLYHRGKKKRPRFAPKNQSDDQESKHNSSPDGGASSTSLDSFHIDKQNHGLSTYWT
jgi:hypothetical protein